MAVSLPPLRPPPEADPGMDFNAFLDIDGDPIAPHFTKHAPDLSFGVHVSSRWQTSPLGDVPADMWLNEPGYRLPDSWSQTIDSLLSQSPPFSNKSSDSLPAGHSSSDTNASASTSATSNASTSSYPGPTAVQPSALPTSPSDPFNLLPNNPQPEDVVARQALARPPSDNPTSSGEIPSPVELSSQNESIQSIQAAASYAGKRQSEMPASVRRLFESIPEPPASNPSLPQQQFVAPGDLSLTRTQPSILGPPTAQSTPGPTEALLQAPRLCAVEQPNFRGLSGWRPDARIRTPLLAAHKPFTTSSVPGLKPPCPRPSVVRLPRNLDTTAFTAPQPRRCTRKSTFPSKSPTYDMVVSDDGGDEDDDSDVYQPSSSPARSPANSREASPYTLSYPETYRTISNGISLERQSRRGKGKAKGSAALALAVVTQMSKLHQQEQDLAQKALSHKFLEDDDDDMDLADAHLRAVAVRPGRKRKNSSIPLPVPVPHLIKKSRGRKVPYIPQDSVDGNVNPNSSQVSTSTAQSTDESQAQAQAQATTIATSGPVRATRGSRSGRKATTPYSLVEGGKRAYMCDVQGCGKCFVRGEHLKRHIRSIHTYDKPHPCPYNGCDKTFSRRDNLGQHVRIHLQA